MKHTDTALQKVQIRTYSGKEIADFYSISQKTLRKWLSQFEKEIGQRPGYLFTPKQIEVIFDNLGVPKDKYLE